MVQVRKKTINQKKQKITKSKKNFTQKILSIGAEAVLTLQKNKEKQMVVLKKRLPKSYRIKEIDQRLRSSRTRREVKVLEKLAPFGFVPKVFFTDAEKNIEMEYLSGERLSTTLEQHDVVVLGQEIGEKIKQMHEQGIIHGDLTTSNMILMQNEKTKQEKAKQEKIKQSSIYFIDFGLSFFSQKEEDKAVDLHLLEEALESKHHTVSKKMFAAVKAAYADKEVLKRLQEVEARGRNKKGS